MYRGVVAHVIAALALSRTARALLAWDIEEAAPAIRPLTLSVEAVERHRLGTGMNSSVLRGVPDDLDYFKELMQNLTLQDDRERLRREAEPGFRRRNLTQKMLLGIMTTLEPHRSRGRDIRSALKASWMSHPDVCLLDDKMTGAENCTVYVAFVVGESGRHAQQALARRRIKLAANWLSVEPGMIELTVHENMDEGKTYAWFQFASRQFKWANYIAKCDEDVFVHVESLLDGLADASASGCRQAYLGRPWTCVGDERCPPQLCGPPVGHNFLAYENSSLTNNKDKCWSYMQGGMYGMTRPMAISITNPGGYWHGHKIGYEDMMTGRAVLVWLRNGAKQKCMYVWNSTQVARDRMYYHLRGLNEHPGGVSQAWDDYYFPKTLLDEARIAYTRATERVEEIKAEIENLTSILEEAKLAEAEAKKEVDDLELAAAAAKEAEERASSSAGPESPRRSESGSGGPGEA